MAGIGATLKQARERKRLSQAEVAQAIRAKTVYIEAIEAGDFSVFPAPIYALGFIRLYADCVGEDPLPLEQAYRERQKETAAPAERRSKTRAAPAAVIKKNFAPEKPPAPLPKPMAPATEDQPDGVIADAWPAPAEKYRWSDLEKRCPSWAARRLPLETWRFLLAVAGVALLVILAGALLAWHFLAQHPAGENKPAAVWLADPPEPYLPPE
jgi:transcriptional regulator with XRE-family HTH domain